MSRGPTVDDRSREELLAELRTVADSYVEGWDPQSDDAGTTLLEIFSRFEADVLKRLDGVPEKHRIAFLDALDFTRRPPQAARVPLSFETAEDIDGNVVIPGGTQALAETGAGTETFEIPGEDGFEATQATLSDVLSVDPAGDRIVDHTASLAGGEGATLFTGDDVQEHVLYLGHGELLNLEAGSNVTLSLLTNVTESELEDSLTWEYYGEAAVEAPESEDGSDEAGDGDEVETVEGWHVLPQETTDVSALIEESAGIEDLREAVKQRIQAFSAGSASEWGNTPFELSFTLPGEFVETEVDGEASRWIRARADGEDDTYLDLAIESITLNVERDAEEGGIVPDNALSNDVPISLDGDEDVYPLGRMPQPPTTMYLASEEVLTKRGATVEVTFGPPTEADDGEDEADESGDDEDRRTTQVTPGPLGGDPEISWEYWNGQGWSRLRLATDDTDRLREPGSVRFTVPRDLAQTAVSGHEDYWIRARLVSGNYGEPRYAVTEEGTRGELLDGPEPPRYGGITMSYDQRGRQFETVLADNNATIRRIELTDGRRSFDPFEPVAETHQTLYLGFDAPLEEGPINLHVPMADQNYPRTFDPGIRWEYCERPEQNRWARLDVRDGTEGLTERGIVSITFPSSTTAFGLFGRERHWIRVRVTGDPFEVGDERPVERSAEGRTRERRARREGGLEGSRSPPTLSGLHPNTQWAHNVRTIEDEVIGGSDGSHEQVFTCGHVPVTDVEVWVDELAALSKKEQRQLLTERPEDVDRVAGVGDDPEAFWVRWTGVGDFLDSTADDRHYVVDRTTGTISFGDGQRGAIPPADEDNVRATYRTGGGSDGNVEAGAITDLRNPISLVDSVTNLRPSDGGADAESMDAVADRAPQRIKNRGRAVTASDFEGVARDASRELAKVKCEPEMDERGRHNPGWVTLLVVPRERREQPTPSLELRQRVQRAVAERAPATLVGAGRDRIVVRGPSYAAVSVDATVTTEGVESVSTLKTEIESQLDRFFHPLTGGTDGEGWSFAQPPRYSTVVALIEAVDGVASVEDAVLSVATRAEERKIRAEGTVPDLSRDTLICSGTHEVDVNVTGVR